MSTYTATKPLVPSEKENTPQGVCEKIIEIARKNFSEDELGDALRGESNELVSERDNITDEEAIGIVRESNDKLNRKRHNSKLLLGEIS